MTQYAKQTSSPSLVTSGSHDVPSLDGGARGRNLAQTDALLRTGKPESSPPSKAPSTGLFDAEHLTTEAKEMAAAAECGDHGLFHTWLTGEMGSYQPADWTTFVGALDDHQRALIRNYMRTQCTVTLQEKLRAVLPPQLVFEPVDKGKGKDLRDVMVSSEPKAIAAVALEIAAACHAPYDEGRIYKWLRTDTPNVYTYTNTDWKSFLAPLDDKNKAAIRTHLAESCTPGLLEQLRTVLPPDLVILGGRVPREQLEAHDPHDAHDPHGGHDAHDAHDPHDADGSPQTAQTKPTAPKRAIKPVITGKPDALNALYADRDSRAEELADKVVKAMGSSKKLEAVAMVLEGSPILGDPAMRKKFIAAYNKKMNAEIDRYNELGEAIERSGFGSVERIKHVHHKNAPESMDQIIDAHFSGNASAYLKQLARDGRSSPLWKTRLALGLVEGARSAAETEVFNLVMEAPGELPKFGMSLADYWKEIDTPLKAKLDKPRYGRLAAMFQEKQAEQALEQAHEHEEEAKAELGHAVKKKKDLQKAFDKDKNKKNRMALKLGKDKADEAKTAVEDAQQDTAAKKAALNKVAIDHLAAMIVQLAPELNKLEPAAVQEIKEWAQEHGDARADAVKLSSVALGAIATNIKKQRDRAYLTQLIKGDSGGTLSTSLQGKGFHQDELRTDEVVGAQAIVDREQAKHTLGKGKDHTNLKAQLMAMSAEGREQYLAEISGMQRAELLERPKRHTALAKLSEHFAKVGLKEADAEQLAAMFRTNEVGTSYARLRALVLTTEESSWTSKSFGQQAYQLVLELEGPEYYQVRSDHTMLKAFAACTKAKDITAFLGATDQLKVTPSPDHKAVDQARNDAELAPSHWSLSLGHELEKRAIPIGDSRDRDKVFLLAHQAQNAAHRAVKAGKTDSAAKFMLDVKTGLSDGAKGTLHKHYEPLEKAIDTDAPITTDMVLGEVLYHDGKIGGHGKTFYHHINVEHFTQAFEQCEGPELLEKWSNIQEFRDGLEQAKQKGNEADFKSQFVLDASDEKKQLIRDVVGSAKAPAVLKKLRDRLREAAEHDEEFKKELDDGGVNSLFHRERMGLRGSLEQADQRRKGWQFSSFSSKGAVDAQRQREVVGGGRTAYSELAEVEDGEEQDKLYAEHHQEDIEKNQAGLERTGASFTALRAKVRKYTEIAITIAMMVIATAAAAGITAATFGAGAVTLPVVAALWAKFGIMLAAKLTAIAVGAVVKEAIGNQITGEDWNSRRVGTDIAVNSAGAVIGGIAGTGVEAGITMAGTVSSAALVELAKTATTAGAKAGSKQLTKWIMERETGEVTVLNTLIAVATTELSSIPGGEVSIALSHEQDLMNAEHTVDTDKDHINEAYHHDGLTGHADSDPSHQADQLVEHRQDDVEHAKTGVESAQSEVDADSAALGHAETTPSVDHPHEALQVVQDHTMKAHVLIGAARHSGFVRPSDLELAQHHCDVAQGHLEMIKGDEHAPPNVEAMQDKLADAQAKLEDAQAKLEDAQTRLEEAQHDQETFEHDEATAKSIKLDVAERNIYAKPMDFVVEKTLDEVLDKLIDVMKERSKSTQRKEKLEQAEKLKGSHEKAE